MIDGLNVKAIRTPDTGAWQFWELGETPPMGGFDGDLASRVRHLFDGKFADIMGAPFFSEGQTRQNQLSRAFEIVSIATERLPFYKEKYRAAGVQAGRLRSWNDFFSIPPVLKSELQQAFPFGCVDPSLPDSAMYRTRSSGSSGITLDIRVDREAMAIDTIQGIRQYALQSGLSLLPSDEIVSIGTVPWPLASVAGRNTAHFISSIVSSRNIAAIVDRLRPSIITGYPTVLKAVVPYLSEAAIASLKVIIFNSEQSTARERASISAFLGVPVLDEYSSEEATRIALELPCGHYHVCEDTVIAEVLDPDTLLPQAPGQIGVVAITNLLNTAMPFIRYVQGDLAALAPNDNCNCTWAQLSSLQGRINDALVATGGRLIPAGAILDATYRMMFDSGVSVADFEIWQTDIGKIEFRVSRNELARNQHVIKIKENLQKLLESLFGERLDIELVALDSISPSGRLKRRPIRRVFEHRYT